jgi:hypothetical protein
MARTRKKMEKEYGTACSIQQFRDTYPPCMKQKEVENSKEYKQRTNRCILTKKSALQYLENSKGPFTYKRSTQKKCGAAQRAFFKKYGKEYEGAETKCSKKMMKVSTAILNGNKKTLTPCTYAQLIEFNKKMKRQNTYYHKQIC